MSTGVAFELERKRLLARFLLLLSGVLVLRVDAERGGVDKGAGVTAEINEEVVEGGDGGETASPILGSGGG